MVPDPPAGSETGSSAGSSSGSSSEVGALIFVSDASAEAERLISALRTRGYQVVDVPLGLLVNRVSVQRPALILCDADAPGAVESVERIHRDFRITAIGRIDDGNIERQIRAAEQQQIVRKRNDAGRRIETRNGVELDRRGVVVGAGIANGAHGEERGRDGRSRNQADLHGGTFGARGDEAS